MNKLLYYLPTIIFNGIEFVLLLILGMLIAVPWHQAVSILIVFMLVRNLLGLSKHYKNPITCLIWSLLVFGLLFVIIKINYILAIVLIIFYAMAQTGRVDVRDTYMWKGSTYKYLEMFIQNKRGSSALNVFEDKLEEINPRIYNVYKYRFIKGYSYDTISEILKMDKRRISEIMKALELTIRMYFDVT